MKSSVVDPVSDRANYAMCLKILIVVSLVLCTTPVLTARLTRPWTYQEIFEQADLVVIATFVSTKDTDERTALQDLSHPVKVIGVTTEFKTELVLKGPKEITNFQLHHYRFEDAGDALWVNAPQLIRLPTPPQNGVHYAGHETFLMFLVREKDGRYAPVTGQTDPVTYSVRELRQ